MTCPLVDFLRNAGPEDTSPSGRNVSEIIDALASDMTRMVRARRARGYDYETAA